MTKLLYTPSIEFQTPSVVAEYMANMLALNGKTVLEPTPGIGNLVRAIKKLHPKAIVTAPENFEDIPKGSKFDCVIMNPPFTPMKEGYRYLKEALEMSDNVIALLPWFILINSERRLDQIIEAGLISITHLPRKTFPRCRIQCCILEIRKGYEEVITYKRFEW